MKSIEKRLLREYVRRTLKEDFSDYGGLTPWSGGWGGSPTSSRSSSGSGTGGNSLISIFIDPFVQAAKVIGAELGQTGVRIVTLAAKSLETVLDALIPGFQADYERINKTQKKYLEKIKQKYEPAYKAVAENWEHPDLQLFAFMHSPTTWLTYKAITSKPEAALTVYDAIAEGSQTLTLYLRDIRNRLFGASTPGAGLHDGSGALPVKSENFRRTLRGTLRENGDVVKHIDFQGLEISIDRPKGFVQTGTNSAGEDWERTYLYDYGFIKDTEGGDGEDLDVFIGPELTSPTVYIVTQNHADGSFDEYKAFVGFSSVEEVLDAYEAHIPVEFFEDIASLPVGAIKGMLGLDPLNEDKATRPKTPGEQLADIFTSKQFQDQINKLPIVQQMQKDAAQIEGNTASKLQSTMTPILNANSAQDLAAASGGSWSLPPEYSKFNPEEKQIFDDTIVKQVKASMATYYESQLKELLKQLAETGINDQSLYAISIRRMIALLDSVKQQAATPSPSSKGTNTHGQEQEQGYSTPNPTGRAQGTGKPGGGVRAKNTGSGRGDRSTQSGSQGNSGGVQRKTGRQDTERSPEDSEDQKHK